MSGHYCTEHKAIFFKKGNMKGYAHPIEGASPTKWCNEPEGGGDPIPEEVEAKPTPRPVSGEEMGMWWKELGKRIGDGSLGKDFPKSLIKIKGQYYGKMFETLGLEKEG